MKRFLPCCAVPLAILLLSCGKGKPTSVLSGCDWYVAHTYVGCIYPDGRKDEAAYHYSVETSDLRVSLHASGLGVVWYADSTEYPIAWHMVGDTAIYLQGFMEGDDLWTIDELSATNLTISQHGELAGAPFIRTMSFVSNLNDLLDKVEVDSLNGINVR